MKTKFYDKPPDISRDLYETDCRDFKQEIHFIANLLGISVGRINICGDHPVGEDVIFIDGHYNGYLDLQFYNYMDAGIDEWGDFEEWVEKWRDKK